MRRRPARREQRFEVTLPLLAYQRDEMFAAWCPAFPGICSIATTEQRAITRLRTEIEHQANHESVLYRFTALPGERTLTVQIPLLPISPYHPDHDQHQSWTKNRWDYSLPKTPDLR